MVPRLLLWSALVALCLALFVVGAAASPGSMTCGPGPGGEAVCHWGFNYQGPSTNEIVTGGNTYWKSESIDKRSGGTVYTGFGPSGCHKTFSGVVASSWHASDIGCGGYIKPLLTVREWRHVVPLLQQRRLPLNRRRS